MDTPSFLLSRPCFDKKPEMVAAFDNLFQSTPIGAFIEYSLPFPKWQFLSFLCETKNYVLHGSQNLGISQVEPRQANDKRAYSNQLAIYATTDGIWVLYYAILDRKKYPEVSLFNSCFQARISPDQFSEPLYFFSITQSVLIQKPWCTGAIYSAAQVQYHSTGVLRQEVARNSIQFLRSLANQNDSLVWHTQPGEIVIHPVEDLLGLGIKKQRISRLSFCVKCDQQGFLFRSQGDF